ncbi:MAG: hypothetical protein AMXMBFR84_31560 [Candidatus Hydrogenedentota bacterium]
MPLEVANFVYEHLRGPIFGWFSQNGLTTLRLPHSDQPPRRIPLLHSWKNDQRTRALNTALERYFAGLREDFESIPLDLEATTPFQQRVYSEAQSIKWGATSTYGGLCDRMGLDNTSARAVGTALGANPVAILVPCHRFLSSTGKLTGFAAGLAWKEELLRLEGALI